MEQMLASEMERILNGIKDKVVQSLPEVIEGVLKPAIKGLLPTEQEEADMLSKAVNGIGTWEGGRFLRAKDGGIGMSLREAVDMEKPVIYGDAVGFLSKAQLRNNTIFAWRRGNGEMLSIDPDKWFFVNALEYGGAQYTVKPRSDRKALYPEDGVYRAYMVKAIYPRRMFWNSVNSSGFSNALKERIKRAVNEKV